MSLFSILRSRKLSPAWQYQARGLIWRLLPASPGYLVGEDRDHTQKSVNFFCLDEATGVPRWKDMRFPEPWWISVEAVHRNVAFLHEFVRPDMPQHRKIIAVDLDSGNTLWANEDYKFMFAHGDCVYAMQEMFEKIAVYELDLLTGKIVRELEPEYVRVLRETTEAEPVDVEYPASLVADGGSDQRQTVMQHIETKNLRGEIEFIQSDPYVVVGYYENASDNPLEQEMSQHLKVVDAESGSLVFSDRMAEKAKMAVTDLFFVRNNMLFYIKNGNLLKAVKLTQP